MSDFEKDDMELEESVVVMTDEEGNEYYYVEEEVIVVGDKRFAVLAPIDAEEGQEHECGCESSCGGGCGCEDEAIIAKIETDENGEDVYCNPTDEEFEEVLRIYEERDQEE